MGSHTPPRLLTAADARVSHLRVHDVGTYHRVRPGVYVERVIWDGLAPWERYDTRVRAFAAQHPGTVFAFESAASLLGMPVFGEPRDIHIFSTVRTMSRRFGDVAVHTSSSPRTIVSRDGLFATSLADTAVDLMRVLPPALALAIGDMAIAASRGGTASLTQLRALATGQVNTRGQRQLAMLWDLIDAQSESVGESVSRAVACWLGYERPELQISFITDGFTDRVDMWWPSVRAIGESDGYAKYAVPGHATPVSRLVAEKQREDRLRRRCDTLRRWDWADVMRVHPFAARLAEMRVPRISAPREALLRTIGQNPRSLGR